MLIPSLTTIRVEDFPSQREWIGNLLFPINQFLLAATTTLNGNTTLGDNIPCQTQTLTFVANGSNDFPQSFKCTLVSKPVEVRVAQGLENEVPIILTNPAWSFSGNQITLSNILKQTTSGNSALTQGAKYSIVLRIQP